VKLLMVIVSSDDAYALLDALSGEGHQATLVGTTGGFLRQGNATILIGVTDENLAAVLKIVRATCPRAPRILARFHQRRGPEGL
jgi:uncharacterized protein YaaQ